MSICSMLQIHHRYAPHELAEDRRRYDEIDNDWNHTHKTMIKLRPENPW